MVDQPAGSSASKVFPHLSVRFQKTWNSVSASAQGQVFLDAQGIPSDGPVNAPLVPNVPQYFNVLQINGLLLDLFGSFGL